MLHWLPQNQCDQECRAKVIKMLQNSTNIIANLFFHENFTKWNLSVHNQEPILRLLNLQQQRQRCSRLERFFKVKKLFS
jgi:hypothetical protein